MNSKDYLEIKIKPSLLKQMKLKKKILKMKQKTLPNQRQKKKM